MPSLMQLPPELHIQIIKNLKLFPATMLLRLINKHFYNLIHPVSNEEMGLLEYKAYSDAHKFRCCEDCHRLRPGQKFMPSDLFPTVFEPRICIDCGMHNKSYVYPRGLVFESKWQVGVMCEDCPELPKGSLRRLEDLCQECWTKLERRHGTFPLWKKGLSEEEVLSHQAKLFQGTERLHHQACCRKCWRRFGGCELLMHGLHSKRRKGEGS